MDLLPALIWAGDLVVFGFLFACLVVWVCIWLDFGCLLIVCCFLCNFVLGF